MLSKASTSGSLVLSLLLCSTRHRSFGEYTEGLLASFGGPPSPLCISPCLSFKLHQRIHLTRQGNLYFSSFPCTSPTLDAIPSSLQPEATTESVYRIFIGSLFSYSNLYLYLPLSFLVRTQNFFNLSVLLIPPST